MTKQHKKSPYKEEQAPSFDSCYQYPTSSSNSGACFYNNPRQINVFEISNMVNQLNDKPKSNLIATNDYIGGNEIIVEIEESKFGKRKYNRGIDYENSKKYLDHKAVNHSRGFINSISGVHTNTIEANRSPLKKFIPDQCRTEEIIRLPLKFAVGKKRN
ncbi:hypothetical protein CWI36_0043p0030 [Hamiltosporidium magnivora]|uniref:Uncharacterized protein n=1 Tax=Hamiltosporidium magnivora TaxID=148818 RepID=A0A4Q9LLY5_9MICR|nr:hypothetical protein CWI36_0043p0030 [Hamiltosporidium magnivora]